MDVPAPPTPRPRATPVPTTFGGVAAVAWGPAWWLAVWQILVALVAALVLVWALAQTWGRALQHAVGSLPQDGEIRDGRLAWNSTDTRVLHRSSYLSILVDPTGHRREGQAADVTLCLEDDRFAVHSLFGWVEFPYGANWRIPLGRQEMSGLLEAWRGPVLLAIGIGTFLVLLVSWIVLATLYALALGILAAILRRELTAGRAWRLAGAALIPGAAAMTAAIALYATRNVGLVGLLLMVPGHLALGWIFCAGALPRAAPRRGANPFADAKATARKRAVQRANPFETT